VIGFGFYGIVGGGGGRLIQVSNHLADIPNRFRIGRDAMILLDTLGAGVVGGQRFHHVIVKKPK
jgi:hypothetical protein